MFQHNINVYYLCASGRQTVLYGWRTKALYEWLQQLIVSGQPVYQLASLLDYSVASTAVSSRASDVAKGNVCFYCCSFRDSYMWSVGCRTASFCLFNNSNFYAVISLRRRPSSGCVPLSPLEFVCVVASDFVNGSLNKTCVNFSNRVDS